MASRKLKIKEEDNQFPLCSKCGKPLTSDAKFCGNCGKKIIEEPLYCKNCGAQIGEEEKFCTNCGEPTAQKQEQREKQKPVEEQQEGEKTKIDFRKMSIFILILLLVIGLVISGFYYGPRLLKKQQTNESATDTNQSEEEPQPEENNTEEGPCKDECNYEGKAKCEVDTFYYCEDKNNDGCLEKTVIDKCSTGFTCANEFTCESSTNKNKIYQIELIEELEDQADQRLKVGDSFDATGKLGGKIQDIVCDITKIYKEYARYVCEKTAPKQPVLRITKTQATTQTIKITIKNSGSSDLIEEDKNVHFSVLRGGNTVCGLSLRTINSNIDDDELKVEANSEFELRLSFGDFCAIEDGQSYSYKLEIGPNEEVVLTGNFNT